jgi:DNA-binding beta-propeller fold protein YncE
MNHKRLILLALLATTPAYGWEAKCFQENGEACGEDMAGPLVARNNWGGEHGMLAQTLFTRLGFDPALLEAVEVVNYTSGEHIQQAGAGNPPVPDIESAIPVDFRDVESRVVRSLRVTQFAELPDMAYSMADWLTGNETCPLAGADPNPVLCHVYAFDYSLFTRPRLSLGYIGPVNTTHFSPQAGAMHAHYHQVALGVARQCAEMAAAFGPERAADERFAAYLKECDWLALAMEGVGQHFLQDVWSAGHMWHRWGGPTLESVRGTVTGGIVAAVTGFIHGAKSLVPFADDPLCYPTDRVEWRVDDGPSERGIGDIFANDLLADATFQPAEDALMGCSAAHYLEVYSAGALSFGPAPALPPAVYGAGDARCYGPRVTNRALQEGFDLRINQFIRVDIIPRVAALMAFIGGDLDLEARADMVSLSFKIQLAAVTEPEGTWMARNDANLLGSFLGVQPNEAYLDLVPAAYHDPLPPWTTEQPYPKVFRKTHADLWCRETPLADLGELASRCITEGGGEAAEADLPAACRLCEELADARFRAGCSDSDPNLDPTHDGACRYLVDDPSEVEWLYLPLNDGQTPSQRIQGYCRGTHRSQSLCDRVLVVDRVGGRLIQVEPNLSVSLAIPTGATAQRVAVSTVGPPMAVVTNEGAGTVSLVDLGNGHEVDWDGDPATTDAGAPEGMTRLVVPGPRGVAFTPDGRYALVVSNSVNVLAILDVLRRRMVGLVPLPAARADSVVVGLDGTKAYISLAGTIQVPDNRIVVANIPRLLDADPDNDALGLIEHVGGNSRPSRLRLAPDDSTVAVVLPGVNRVGWLDMATDSIIDLTPDRPESQFILMDFPPTDVAWAVDGSANFVTEVAGEAGPGGSVRRVAAGQIRLDDPIPVGQSPRAIAMSANGQRAYIANGDNTLTIIDPNGGGVVATFNFADAFLQVTPSDIVLY